MACLCASNFVGRAFAGGFSFGEPLEGRVSTLDANSTAFLGCHSRAHSQSRLCCGHLVGRTSIFLATSLIIVQHRFSVTSLPFRLVVPTDCFCSPQYDSMKMVAVSLGSSCVGLPSKAARFLRAAARCYVICPNAISKSCRGFIGSYCARNSRRPRCGNPHLCDILVSCSHMAINHCAHHSLHMLPASDLCICPGNHNTRNSNLMQTI